MKSLLRDIPTGNYILEFVDADIKPTLKNLDYQIKKVYEFTIINESLFGRKIFHHVYTQDQAKDFEKTFENGRCCVEIYFDRPRDQSVILSSRKWSGKE